jgi:tripartite motif-containing protein 71
VQGRVEIVRGARGNALDEYLYPNGLALTPDGQYLLIADRGNRRIVVVNAVDGRALYFLQGPAGTLREPRGVAVTRQGQVLVCDREKHTVIVFSSFTQDATTHSYDVALRGPRGIAVMTDHETELMVLADTDNHRVVILDLVTGKLQGNWGSRGTNGGQFVFPSAVAASSCGTQIIVGDSHRVQILTSMGEFIRSLGLGPGVRPGHLSSDIFGLSVSPITGDIVVCDGELHRISVFRTDDGSFLHCFGNKGKWRGAFDMPIGIVFDARGHAWVSIPSVALIDQFYFCLLKIY